ncbi:MAG: hypothetical protein AAFV53_32685 [Myxococcota bacterium]
MNRISSAALVGLLALTASSDAQAGSVSTMSVTITTEYYTGLPAADGYLNDTRYSSSTNEFIGCRRYRFAGVYTTSYGFCSARTASGGYLSCYAYDTEMLDIIDSIQPESRLLFSVDAGVCDMISVSNYSNGI